MLVLVNPIGGKGKGKAISRETVIPILEAAGCQIDVRGMLTCEADEAEWSETTHRLHAEEIAREVELVYE